MAARPDSEREPVARAKHTRTIRMRLTLIYGTVFLIAGLVALTLVFVLVRHSLLHQPVNLKQAQTSDYPKIIANAERQRREYRLKHHLPVHRYPHGHHHRHDLLHSKLVKNLVDTSIAVGYHSSSDNGVHKLLRECIAGLLGMILVSVWIGWVIAGRALAPLREITATARRVSGENLGERIDLQGPNDELKELADTFDAMLARLDQTFASQRHFVANASHELRTPLAIMRTELDVALADPDASAEELRQMGEDVRETIDRGEALVAALLQLARSEAITGHEEPVDMAELAGDVITDLHRRAEQAGVKIITDLRAAVAFGESALLERVLTNLIDNAIRHNRQGGSLWVTTRTHSSDPMIEITVRNDGQKLDPQQVPALTEPFRRLTRTAGGFGLGLSIVKSVAEAHGGSIELEARPEGGLEIKVQLPSAAIFLSRG